MDSSKISIGFGRWDWGASHRAVDIGRYLAENGQWDGHTPIAINNVYELHRLLFGVCRGEYTPQLGVDYEVRVCTNNDNRL